MIAGNYLAYIPITSTVMKCFPCFGANKTDIDSIDSYETVDKFRVDTLKENLFHVSSKLVDEPSSVRTLPETAFPDAEQNARSVPRMVMYCKETGSTQIQSEYIIAKAFETEIV